MDALKKIILVVVTLAVLYAVVPFFGKNYIPTHDGEYHIIRIVEFAKELGHGVIVPRWAPDLNNGYGVPIFEFNYPLPNYIGSLLRLVTRDAVYAFQWSVGLGYLAIVVFAYLWLSVLFGGLPALVGAMVIAFTPYLLVDVYIRGSIGEVWATAFLFLSLYVAEKKKSPWFALSYGMLILSHNILAMLYTPFIAVYLAIRNAKLLPWMIGGIGLSAFFWLPAIAESKYVVGLNTVNFRDYFVDFAGLLVPSWGSGFAGLGGTQMSVQIGAVPLAAIAFSALRKKKYKVLFGYFIAVLVACVFFMLPISEPLWSFIKPLQFTQYPWRLLSFVIVISGFCAAAVTATFRRAWVGFVFVLLAFAGAWGYRPVLYQPRSEQYYLSRPNFTMGTSSMGNSFSTVWSGWRQASDPYDPIHTLYFPGWKVYVDGKEVPVTNDHGLLRATITPGKHTVTKRLTETPIRLTADIISVVTLGAIIISLCILP